MDCNNLLEIIDGLETEYIEFWKEVCSIESPSDCKEGVDKASACFIKKAKELGMDIEINRQEVSGDCVLITLNKASKEAPIVFSGHLDTVHPIGSFGYPAVHTDENNIYGPGVSDCKGGTVGAMLALHALKNAGFLSRPVMLILQSDEEVGSRTSKLETVKFMCEKSKNAVAFLNLEPHSNGYAVVERKGIIRYTFKVSGKAAHSSECCTGKSAIAEAAYKIIELEKFKNPEGITINCGKIEGGSADNTVPEFCTFTCDIRFKNEEEMNAASDIVKKIAETSYVEGTKCSARLKSKRIAMKKCEKNLELLQKMNEIYKKAGLPELKPTNRKGGSDAAYTTAAGIPCVDSIGTEGGGFHALCEYSKLSSLKECAKRLAAVAYYI